MCIHNLYVCMEQDGLRAGLRQKDTLDRGNWRCGVLIVDRKVLT